MRFAFLLGEKVSVPDVGDKIVRPVYFNGHELERATYKGVVVYVHPELRYYTVQFGEEPRSYRESYIIGR